MRIYALIMALLLLFTQEGRSDSWQQAKLSKKATLNVNWFVSIPFIYTDADGQLVGIEKDIIALFEQYLLEKSGIDLTVNWIEAEGFYDLMQRTKNAKNPNVFGASAFSITKERREFLNFTDSYLQDITVLVSSEGTPIVHKYNDIDQMMDGMLAITIKGTIYEKLLFDLKQQLNIDFDIHYIHSEQNVLDHISQSSNMFGFIDLPIYLMWIKNGKNIPRQNFFTVRGSGYGYIMPKKSDLHLPFNEFLADSTYQLKVRQVISKYLGSELQEFIDNSYLEEELGTYILTKEKEIQLELIKNANLKLEEEKTFKRILILGIAATLLFLIIIMYLFYNNQKTTKLIIEQKDQIESQQSDIRNKNEQLLNRNAQLFTLNEDKNNLVSILAHDLRSPLNNILGLSNLMQSNNDNPNKEHQNYLDKISETANRMNQMIAKILDPSTLEASNKAVLKEKVDVGQLIEDLSSRYKPSATNKDIEIQISGAINKLTLVTDHMLLFLVLENLLSNAVKFSPPNSQISIHTYDENGQILITISDQGPGFTNEDKKLVFSRFQKLSAQPTGKESSTGLGLSIVKKYVKDLGGQVWLESEAGKGSTFFVSLPA